MSAFAARLVALSLVLTGTQHALYQCGALGHAASAAQTRALEPQPPEHAACHHQGTASPDREPAPASGPACCAGADALVTLPAGREPALARSAAVPAPPYASLPAAAGRPGARATSVLRAPVPDPGGARFPRLRSHLAFATILV